MSLCITEQSIAALVARLRNRREMVNCSHGDVRDIPDVDCEQAADALTAQQAALAAAGKNTEALLDLLKESDERERASQAALAAAEIERIDRAGETP